jgi:O-antigen/teichoic acid export membrane protein
MLIALNGEITELLLPQSYHGRTGLLFPAVAFAAVCANLTSVVYGAVIHAHKRPWLLIIATSLGSVATIALSVIQIPNLDELGAAVALAGGSAMALGACVVISERLTPIPVPWRDIALSLVTACATGTAAYLAATVLRDMPVLVPLAVGGTVGASMLLLMTWLLRPATVRKVFTTIRRNIGTAQG